jgi:chromosome segregation ATPase
MGEQFKRRLLMDGQYGNIAFICTQTDDCEATEIMRDHGDIAVKIPGRWEKMTSFRDRINNIETNLSDLKQQEEDLQFAVDEAKDLLEELSTNLQNANTPTEISDDDESFQLDDDQVDTDVLAVKNRDEKIKKELMEQVSNQKLIVEEHNKALLIWRDAHKDEMGKLSSDCNNLQRKLKTICAGVRNEYSTKCLQDDFITGLKEIYRDADESPEDEESNVEVPSDISLPVFCISANDYLKVTG